MARAAFPILLLSAAIASSASAGDPPSEAELKGLAYAGIRDEPVTLVDGRWEGEPFVAGGASRPRVELVREFLRSGDVDGDDREEAVVMLAESSGGSGVVSHLAIVARREGRAVNVGTARIGDRVQLRAARVADRKIALEVVQAGPDDAACCPSQLATRVFAMEGGALREAPQQLTGTLSLDTLGGNGWVLTHFARDEPAPAEPVVTLELREGRFVGTSGCNRYFAAPSAGEAPGEISVGPVGGTRMACPGDAMDLETRYLQALQAVTRFGFLGGKLALSWTRDDATGTLLFDSRPGEAP